jgi:hypothetical protein
MDNLTEENANDNIKVFSGLLVEIEKVGIKNLRILISHNCSEKVNSNLDYAGSLYFKITPFCRFAKCRVRRLSSASKVGPCFDETYFIWLYTFHMILTTDNIWRNWISRFSVDFRTDEMPKIYLKKKPGEIFPVVFFQNEHQRKYLYFTTIVTGSPEKLVQIGDS